MAFIRVTNVLLFNRMYMNEYFTKCLNPRREKMYDSDSLQDFRLYTGGAPANSARIAVTSDLRVRKLDLLREA